MSTDLTEQGKWMISLYTVIVFFLLVNPVTFKIIDWITRKFGFPIANDKGCPNGWGLILHGIVFFFIVRLMMFVPLPGVKK